jgi:hypothetical protein
VEQRLAALFATVGNALDSTTYTYSDSDYLVRKALIAFLDQENALVASARKIPDSAQVVDSVLNYVISTEFNNEDPATWYRKAMSIVVEFADLAYNNESSEEASRFAVLLPEGHPRVARVLSVTASAHRRATAEWIAADPRLSEDAAAIVYQVYSADTKNSDDLAAQFSYLKLGALVSSGQVPEDLYPIVAAFKMSFAERSRIAKMLEPFRNRDRKGQFADELGPIKGWFYSDKRGFFSATSRQVGPGSKPGTVISEFIGQEGIPDGLYEQNMAKSEAILAVLPDSAVRNLKKAKEVVAKKDQKDAVNLDQFLGTKVDSPLGWTRGASEGGKARDFWKSSDGNFEVFKRDGKLVLNKNGKEVAATDGWADLQAQYILNGGKVDAPGRTTDDFQPFKRPEDDFPELKTPARDSRVDEFRPYDGRDVGATNRNSPKRAERKRLEDSLGRKLTPEEISALDLELESESFVGKRSIYEGAEFYVPGQDAKADAKYKEYEKKRAETLRKLNAELEGKNASPDLDQDVAGDIDKSELSPSLLGEGYNFSKEGENSWVQEGVGSNGESYSVSKAPNGKWVVSERSGSEGDNAKERDLQSFDNAEEAFEFANDQGVNPKEFDQDWVKELQKDQSGPDLDQNVPAVRDSVDRSKLSPETAKKFAKELDEMDDAIAGNNPKQINDLLEKAAINRNIPDDVYGALASAKDARSTRGQIVENAIAGGSKEDLEALAENPKFAGWSDRLQDALAQDVDLDQDAPTLSEKQTEPATGKQYAFLQEFLEEKNLDPATEQALKDALENKNLNKAQASSLIALGRTAGFKDGVDSSKPSSRMIDSLQGYLATKDLAPSEIKEVLDSLEKDGSRDNVDALLNKLRRKKDKPVELNQGISSLTKYSEGSYEWEDSYNNVGVNKTKNGWEVEYTNPDLNERGGQTWHNQIFNSEAEALAFAEELVKQNQDDAGYDRAASDFAGMGDFFRGVDLDQDVKGTTADKATDKQWNFLQSLLDGKKIDDPNLESAVRSALEDKNLTKGEVGAFIGALRNLEDKPNARREPSAKQIASIKRALLERDLTPEERKSMQDKLAAGLSFDEASEMLNDLKKRDITPMGMINLLDALKSDQDIDSLRYLLDKPEYSKYRTDIKDTLRQLALDTEDPNLQEFIDAREEPDLDQDVNSSTDFNNFYPHKTAQYLERILREKAERLREEGAPEEDIRSAERLSEKMRQKRLEPKKWGERQPSDMIRFSPEEAKLALDSFNEYLDTPENNVDGLGGLPSPSAENYKAKLESMFDKSVKDLRQKLEYISRGEQPPAYKRPPTEKQIASIRRGALERGLSENEAASILDRVDDLSFEDASKIISDLKARPITDEGMDNLVNNSELDVLESIVDRPDYAPWRDKIQSKIDEMKSSPDLDQDVNQTPPLVTKLPFITKERVELGGVAQAALQRSEEPDDRFDLYQDVERELIDDIEAFYLTDREDISRRLEMNLDVASYGNVNSGGAEITIRTGDLDKDGNQEYDARVEYPGSKANDFFIFTDLDEAKEWASYLAADYNSNVVPEIYKEMASDSGVDLAKEARNARSPEEARAFADRLTEIVSARANALGGGPDFRDRDIEELKNYVQRVRDLADRESGPDPTPEEYAGYVGSEVFSVIKSKGDKDLVNNFISADGRVYLAVEDDAYTVIVDDEEVFSGELPTSNWDFVRGIEKAIKDHFEKSESDDVDLDQDVSSSVSRNDIAEKLAEELDALDLMAVNGKDLTNYIEEFDRTKYPSTAAEMSYEVYNLSSYVDDPDLRQRLRDLSNRLDEEIVDRFGIAEAARADYDEILELADVEYSVQKDIEMYFENDAKKIERKLDIDGFYGEIKSGGAEVFVSQEEDGTWTASVQYDRGDEQFNGEDRDEVISQAAVAAADYNDDVMPIAYAEVDDLPGQAAQAQTPDAASELADRMDALADAMDSSRGDRDLAGNLRMYGERIRDMIAAREARNQSEAPSDVLTPETMQEMSTDPDLNPAGYAQYAANDIKRQMEANLENTPIGRTPWTDDGNYTSADGRVTIAVESDVEGRKVVLVIDDEFEWFLDSRTPSRATEQAAKLIEEHFSKKD